MRAFVALSYAAALPATLIFIAQTVMNMIGSVGGDVTDSGYATNSSIELAMPEALRPVHETEPAPSPLRKRRRRRHNHFAFPSALAEPAGRLHILPAAVRLGMPGLPTAAFTHSDSFLYKNYCFFIFHMIK